MLFAVLVLSPVMVEGFSATVQDRGQTTVTLSWGPPSVSQGYYKIWRGTIDATGNVSQRTVVYTSTDLTKTVYTDTGLTPGQHYRYTIELYNAADQFVGSAVVDACTQQQVFAVKWDLVGIGVALLVIFIIVAVLSQGAIFELASAAPYGVGVGLILAWLGAAIALIYLGATGTQFLAAC